MPANLFDGVKMNDLNDNGNHPAGQSGVTRAEARAQEERMRRFTQTSQAEGMLGPTLKTDNETGVSDAMLRELDD